jgi:hypothetical protein
MSSSIRSQRTFKRLLAETEAAHGYLDRAVDARNDLIVKLNLEKALASFGTVITGIECEPLEPALAERVFAAQQGLQERILNVASAFADA